MALPFLPEGEILTEFQRLQRQAESPTLAEFAEYVNSTWISNATWSPADWTVFKQAVQRTTTSKAGTTGSTVERLASHNSHFTSWSSCYTGRPSWQLSRSFWYQRKNYEGSSAANTETCRQKSSISGSNMTTTRGPPDSYWKPVLSWTVLFKEQQTPQPSQTKGSFRSHQIK